MGWTGRLPTLCALLLASCSAPQPYRVVQLGDVYKIYQPNTHTLHNGDLAIDLQDVVDQAGACRGPLDGAGLRARRVPSQFRGESRWALRLSRVPGAPTDPFEKPAALRAAIEGWWDLHQHEQCLRSTTRESLIRSAMAQRPMSPEEAIAAWYGPGPLPEGYRTLVLQPGMRVCVTDVMPAEQGLGAAQAIGEPTEDSPGATSSPSAARPSSRLVQNGVAPALTATGYRLAGSSCARLVEGIDGARFDPVASRLKPGIAQPTNAPQQQGGRTINTWTELENVPQWRSTYLIVQPQNMPVLPGRPGGQIDYGQYSLLVMVDARATVQVTPQYGDPIFLPAIEAVRQATLSNTVGALCSEQGQAIRCIRFGERGVFMVDFPVRLNGELVDLPVGSTVETILRMAAPDFLAQDFDRGEIGTTGDPAALRRREHLLRALRMRRWFEGRQVPVRLDPAVSALPLQPGDEIQW